MEKIIQDLPSTWATPVLKDVCEYIQRGKSPKYIDKSELPVINQKCVRWNGVDVEHVKYIHPNQFSQWASERFLQDKDILWNSTGTGTIGRACLYKPVFKKTVVDSHVTIVRTHKDHVFPEYVFYFISSPFVQKKIEDMQSGSTNQVELGKGAIEQTMLPLSPINEQKRIVDRIEQLFSDIDKGEALLKTVQKQLATYRQSVLKAAVTGEIIGKKSNNWKEYNVGQLITDIRYGTAKKCVFNPSKTPVLRIPNVAGGKIDLTDLKHADFTEAELKKLCLEAGDILIVRSNGSVSLVGLSAIVTDSAAGFAYAGYLIRLRLKKDIILPEFLNLYLHSPFVRNKIELQARSTSGVHNVNSDEIKAITLNAPSIKEQELIVDKVEEAFSQIAALEEWCETELKRSATLRQSILKSAFSGKLVAQDPADEPASELLSRIKSGSGEKPRTKAAPARRGRKPRSDKSEATQIEHKKKVRRA